MRKDKKGTNPLSEFSPTGLSSGFIPLIPFQFSQQTHRILIALSNFNRFFNAHSASFEPSTATKISYKSYSYSLSHSILGINAISTYSIASVKTKKTKCVMTFF
jgi:hypothetical protein